MVRQLLVGMIACVALGQTSQAPATADEMQFLRFMLMNIGSVDHHPEAVKRYKEGLVKQFGLNNMEVGVLQSIGLELNAHLKQLRESSRVITNGRAQLAAADLAELKKLADEREVKLEALANRLLNSVRSETAAKLRVPARFVPVKGKTAGGN